MSSKGTIIQAWSEIIKARVDEADDLPCPEDGELIKALATHIISNGQREADTSEDSAKMFADIYEANKVKAQGLIVAILEVVRNIGGLIDVEKMLTESWN